MPLSIDTNPKAHNTTNGIAKKKKRKIIAGITGPIPPLRIIFLKFSKILSIKLLLVFKL